MRSAPDGSHVQGLLTCLGWALDDEASLGYLDEHLSDADLGDFWAYQAAAKANWEKTYREGVRAGLDRAVDGKSPAAVVARAEARRRKAKAHKRQRAKAKR